MSGKKWCILTLAAVLLLLALAAGLTAVIDPYFHYHAPLEGLAYELSDSRQRYINDGISKNFEYDAMLTGTSMMENARSSSFDRLFGVNSVKVPYEGSSLKETDQNLRRAIEANPELKLVFRSLDYFLIIREKDEQLYPEDLYPDYLYDGKLLNDTNYLFNKTVLIENTLPVIWRSLRGEEMTDFDRYSLMDPELFGIKVPEKGFSPPREGDSPGAPQQLLSQVEGNIRQNVLETVQANPRIDFYFVISPYSVIYWDRLRASGKVDEHLDCEQRAAELLVGEENVHLFSFYDCPEIIGDLDSYMDECHYDADVLDIIFRCMAAGEHRLTEENCEESFRKARELFNTGDLAALVR